MRSARSKKWSDSILRYGFFVTACLIVTTAFAQTGGQAVEQEQGQAKEQEQEKQFLYKWTDNKGGVHITDQPSKVPEQYRSTVHQVNAPPDEEKEPREQRSSPDSGISDDAEKEADLKATWQQRIHDAKQHLAALEQQYRMLDQQRNEALGRWGGVASGHLEDRVEADRLDQEMQQVQKDISDIRNQIEVVIPDQARKAGIPPGWLRE